MKKLLLLTLALSLPLAQVVRAENDKDRRRHKRQAEDQPREQAASPAGKQQQRRAVNRAPQTRPRNLQRNQGGAAPSQRQRVPREATSDGRTVNRNRGNPNVAVQRNGSHRNFNRNSFSIARTRVIRTPHNRNWWRNRFNTTFILFGGGYYYWWDNYWYPAYGYDPYYNSYDYGEPIYGYNNLAPGEVIQNAQIALRDQGYYPGEIDGLMGPQTRAALAAYQRDHGLIITSAVDEPTLVTLGLA